MITCSNIHLRWPVWHLFHFYHGMGNKLKMYSEGMMTLFVFRAHSYVRLYRYIRYGMPSYTHVTLCLKPLSHAWASSWIKLTMNQSFCIKHYWWAPSLWVLLFATVYGIVSLKWEVLTNAKWEKGQSVSIQFVSLMHTTTINCQVIGRAISSSPSSSSFYS